MTMGEILQAVGIAWGIVTTLCYSYQLVYMLLPLLQKQKPSPASPGTRYGILIAARNEEKVLPCLLESLQKQTYPQELLTVYVVADNCTDATARIAREYGAVCFQRQDTVHQGKGYALSWLLRQIDHRQQDAFLVFDADNVLRPDYIEKINGTCMAGYDVFCGLRNSKNFGDSWISAGHGLWFLHDSLHLCQSRMLLGNPCIVGGTGFGFTRQLLERCGGWNFFTLTEDIEFSTWCVTHGVKMGYCPQAELFDEQPVTMQQSWRQRTRWVQGGIQVSLRYGKPLLRGMLQGGRRGYACLEAMTLNLWGYGFGVLGGVLGLIAAYCTESLAGFLGAFGTGCAGALGGTFVMGALTLLLSWKRIRATRVQKLLAGLTFPLFMCTYVPICLTAMFRKFHWPPIEHSAALTQQELCK